MKVYVLTGGPGTGKTSVIDELGKEFKVLPETARIVGDTDSRFKGKSAIATNQAEFQSAIFELQKKQIEELNDEEIVFSDRGFGDTLAYIQLRRAKENKEILDYAHKFRYSGIFVFDFLNFYKKDKFRQESREEQQRIHDKIIRVYKDLGYNPIIVPRMSIAERVSFIKKNVLTKK